jgi:hypothetical protein
MTGSRGFTFSASLAALSLSAVPVAACGGRRRDRPCARQDMERPRGHVGVASTGPGKILVDSHGRTCFCLPGLGQSECPHGACASAFGARGSSCGRRAGLEPGAELRWSWFSRRQRLLDPRPNSI